MSKRSSFLLFGTAGLLLAALPAPAQKAHKAKPKTVPGETAVIENTGSTNTRGYRILVSSDGKTRGTGYQVPQETDAGRIQWPILPEGIVARFFTDLRSAGDLTALPARHGMRSASFGTKTYVTYKGRRSPDLTLPGDAKAQALRADVWTITHILNADGPRIPIQADLPDRPIGPLQRP